jgi:hypothetical protein
VLTIGDVLSRMFQCECISSRSYVEHGIQPDGSVAPEGKLRGGEEDSCNRFYSETGAGKRSKVGFCGPKSHSSLSIHTNARILYIYNRLIIIG